MTVALPFGKQIWIRAFYGFGPEEDGYVGWSQAHARDRMMSKLKDGDLILIYGANAAETAMIQRSHVLGIVQIDVSPIRDYEKASQAALDAKQQHGWAEKWTYGLPVRRAWRAEEKVMIRTIAFKTYRPEAGQTLAVNGAALDPDEIAKVMRIKVSETDVFGEPPIAETALNDSPFGEEFNPSRGFPGSTGTHEVTREDGETFLYLATFTGDAHALLGKPKTSGKKLALMKIGVSSDVKERMTQLNAGIPPDAVGRWDVAKTITARYANRKSAEIAEQTFKDASAPKLQSLGGEFFWGDPDEGLSLYCEVPGASRF